VTPAMRAILAALAVVTAGLASASAADAAPLVTVVEGTLPIVLSAPHGGRAAIPGVPVRTGTGARNFVTDRDTATDVLTEKTAAALEKALGGRPYLVIARFDRKYIDANRAPADAYESPAAQPVYDAYHGALSNACRAVRARWGRGLLIDVHGQSKETNTIFRGTMNGRTVGPLLERFGDRALSGPDSLHGRLAALGYTVSPPAGASRGREVHYTGGEVIRAHGAAAPHGLDAIMVEFGRTFRATRVLDRTAGDFATAIAAFARAFLPAADAREGPGPRGPLTGSPEQPPP